MYDVLKDLISYDAVCIPLSGYTTNPHKAAVMNHGVAYKFLRRYGLYLQFAFSHAIEANFNVHRVTSIDYKGHNVDLILFPEKPRFVRIRNEKDLQKLHSKYRHIYRKKINSKPLVPGYLCKSSLLLIERSCKQLRKIANDYTSICLPLPGVEDGSLTEVDVKPVIKGSLYEVADRIYICTTEYKLLLEDWLDIKSSIGTNVLHNKIEMEEFVRASELNVDIEQFISTYFSDEGWSQIKYDVYPNRKKFISNLAITISNKAYEAFRIRLLPVVISVKKNSDNIKFKMVDTKGRTYYFKNKATEVARSKKKLSLNVDNIIQLV